MVPAGFQKWFQCRLFRGLPKLVVLFWVVIILGFHYFGKLPLEGVGDLVRRVIRYLRGGWPAFTGL